MAAELATPSLLSIRNDEAELSGMSRWFRDFAAESGIPADHAADLELCLNELATNIIHYAYDGDDDHEIRIALERTPGELRMTIEDDGREFDPLKAALPEPARTLEEARIGGWGIPIVRALADQIAYERRDGKNRVTCAFRF